MSAERERWAQMCEEQARYQYRRTETRDAWLAMADALRSSEPQGERIEGYAWCSENPFPLVFTFIGHNTQDVPDSARRAVLTLAPVESVRAPLTQNED